MQMMGSGRTRQRLSRRMTRDEITRIARRQEHALRKLQGEVSEGNSDLIKARMEAARLKKELQTPWHKRVIGALRKTFGFQARNKG